MTAGWIVALAILLATITGILILFRGGANRHALAALVQAHESRISKLVERLDNCERHEQEQQREIARLQGELRLLLDHRETALHEQVALNNQLLQRLIERQ